MEEEWTVVGKRGRRKLPKQDSPGTSATPRAAPSRDGTEVATDRVLTTSEEPAARLGAEGRDEKREEQRAEAPQRWRGTQSRRRVRTDEERVRDLVGHVSLAKEEILASTLWRELQRRMQQAEEDALEGSPDSPCGGWTTVEDLVVLGLGSLEASATPRYQLALALLLAEGFERMPGPIRVRDPAFTAIDKLILQNLECTVLESDSLAFSRVSKPTLFYLPHCAASLSHNLLAANWDLRALSKLFLIGNSFEATAEKWREWLPRNLEGKPRPEAVLQLVDRRAVVEAAISESEFPVRGAFNDTSVMLFPVTFDLSGVEIQPLDLQHLADG